MKKYPFWDEKKQTAVGGTYDEVVFDKVEPGKFHQVTHFACRNTTSNITKIELIVRLHGKDHFVLDQQSPKAGYLYYETEEINIPEDGQLVVRFTGCTAGDTLEVFYNAWRFYCKVES